MRSQRPSVVLFPLWLGFASCLEASSTTTTATTSSKGGIAAAAKSRFSAVLAATTSDGQNSPSFSSSSSFGMPTTPKELTTTKDHMSQTKTTMTTTTAAELQEQQDHHHHHHHHRELFWSENADVCSPDILRMVQDAEPTNTKCYESLAQWDKSGKMTIWSLHYNYWYDKYMPFTESYMEVPGFHSLYLAYYDGQECNGFDSCGGGINGPYWAYTYDCSNVYCGPNAKRDCNGHYQTTTACPVGTDEASFVDIQPFAEINCERYVQGVSGCDGLATCQHDTDYNLYYKEVVCEPTCAGCYADGRCSITTDSGMIFGEGGNLGYKCGDVDGTTWCYGRVTPPGLGFSGTVSQFSCAFELNGSSCNCSVCGAKDENGDVHDVSLLEYVRLSAADEVLFQVDCSASSPGSGFSECTDQAAGELDFALLDYTSRCAGGGGGTTSGTTSNGGGGGSTNTGGGSGGNVVVGIGVAIDITTIVVSGGALAGSGGGTSQGGGGGTTTNDGGGGEIDEGLAEAFSASVNQRDSSNAAAGAAPLAMGMIVALFSSWWGLFVVVV